MKHKLVSFIYIVFTLVSSISLVGCFSVDNDEEIAQVNLERLITALDSENALNIRELFAPNVLENIEDFDTQIQNLIDYYVGSYESYEDSGPVTNIDKNGDRVIKWQDMSNDIITIDNIYRISIRWYVKDSNDIDNVGIWSLYIIKFSDDRNPNYSYWGDGMWTNGINIAKVYQD
ncbi:MAG TPA: DUF5104 domain-containing protein [Bacilli bacterium]|nr:DUF5104 domain-containing protein [Bacilli bacterium]